jgi:hypothetical protein
MLVFGVEGSDVSPALGLKNLTYTVLEVMWSGGRETLILTATTSDRPRALDLTRQDVWFGSARHASTALDDCFYQHELM